MQQLTRRTALSTLAALAMSCVHGGAEAAAWPAGVALGPPRPFSFEALKQRAAALAAKPYQSRPGLTPDELKAIDYDAFARLTYGRSPTIWEASPGDGAVKLFPLGRAGPRPVSIQLVEGGEAREVLYQPGVFEIATGSPYGALGARGGFGGFRVLNADRKSDWLAFLGASYFRAADPFNQFGLSARGLAIGAGGPGPEEFPDFTAFWIEHAADGSLVVYALLEGPSVTGAYRIRNHRSPAGLVQDIEAELHFRRSVAELGLGPLTSMYWYGRADRPPGADWRPQIHDSDGLAIWTGKGERIWRPLRDPHAASQSAFVDRSPRGFGLLQRDRRFADFQDDGTFFERRPSAWVEPLGDWGEGAVHLVELPTSGENDDNIVAFWRPAQPVAAGASLPLHYRLHWTDEEPTPVGVARVVATRYGESGPGRRKFVIDFSGGALGTLPNRGDAEPVVTASHGTPAAVSAYPIAGQKDWRLMFDVSLPQGQAVDLRAYLRRGGEALTETWVFTAAA